MTAPDTLKGGPLARRAAILCTSIGFRTFLHQQYDAPAFTEVAAAQAVRAICGRDYGGPSAEPLGSRALLDHDLEAAVRWRDLAASYEIWKQGRQR